jgi:hypothetical protein
LKERVSSRLQQKAGIQPNMRKDILKITEILVSRLSYLFTNKGAGGNNPLGGLIGKTLGGLFGK